MNTARLRDVSDDAHRPEGHAAWSARALVADGARLRRALDDADIGPLLMVLVQLTGAEALLDEFAPYLTGPWDYAHHVPEERQRAVRARLVEVLEAHAAEGRSLRRVPPAPLLRRMMSVCVGETVPAEYVPMMLEEMALEDRDPRGISWRAAPPRQALEGFKVAVVGAGMSGLCAAIRLREAGIPFEIFEKNDTVGGTWYENRYPGCGVDTPNHFYSYSFAPNHGWPDFYSRRDALQAYFERCADSYGIRPSIRFRTEVVSAAWDEAAALWRLTVRGPDGAERQAHANAVLCAVGQLNRPKLPSIPGLDTFRGPAFHTGRWEHEHDLRGRNVAMIGTGASGMQVAPTIAPQVGRLTIFQRSPHWVVRNPNYHRSVGEGTKWVLRHLPYYAKWYRFTLFWGFADGIHEALQIDPAWPHPARSVNAINERHRRSILKWLTREIGDDPALLAKVVPDYPPYGKRILIDNHWYRTLKRDNVALVTAPIARMTPDAIVTGDGTAHRADVLVLATGFHAARMLWPMEITGRGGRRLRALWGEDDPKAYLGIAVPGFPNFFVLYGPNTNLGHGGSAIFHAECQVRYALRCLRELIETGRASMECRQEVHDAYNERVDRAHEGMVWSHPGMGNWYRNRRGRVFANSPWRLVDYWRMTAELDPADFAFR